MSKAVVLPTVQASRTQNIHPHSSLRQSPPPLSDATIPRGAIISPPESAANSSDEEDVAEKKTKTSLQRLDEAIKSIQKQREMSPVESTGVERDSGSSEEVSPLTHIQPEHPLRGPLSAEARKISHSRSSTESSIMVPEAISSSPEDSDHDENGLPHARSMVRKKSGELVRPALRPTSAKKRPSSMPGTPTFAKAVHFDAQLEHIRHFLQLDKPLAVSAETSPIEDYDDESEYPFSSEGGSGGREFEWELRLANFPKDSYTRQHQPVRLERLFLSSDNKNLVGVVAVANIAFHKLVVARFTLDYWRTVSEVTAEYNQDVRRKQAHDGYDRFNFSIKLADQANLESKTMFICIRYNVQGQEFWDNNSTMNYQVDFVKKPKHGAEKHSVLGGVGPRTALPRSRNPSAASLPRPRSMPPSFGDFVSTIDSYDPFPRPDEITKRAADPALRPPREDLIPDAPKRKNTTCKQAFSNRYSFGASLSAAMQTKNTAQDRTVLSAKARLDSASKQNEAAREESGPPTGKATHVTGLSNDATHSEYLKPSSIVSGKPHHESPTYKELVDKYCFYGSPKSPFSNTKRTAEPAGWNVAASGSDSGSRSASTSAQPSGYGEKSDAAVASSSTPRHHSHSRSLSASRLASPTSPLTFGFPYHSMQNNFFSESNAPTAIQG